MENGTKAAAAIEPQRLNGLKLHAARERRSVRNALDLILEGAGIARLTDKELKAALAQIGQKAEVMQQ